MIQTWGTCLSIADVIVFNYEKLGIKPFGGSISGPDGLIDGGRTCRVVDRQLNWLCRTGLGVLHSQRGGATSRYVRQLRYSRTRRIFSMSSRCDSR